MHNTFPAGTFTPDTRRASAVASINRISTASPARRAAATEHCDPAGHAHWVIHSPTTG